MTRARELRKPRLTTLLVLLATGLIAAPGAQADITTCATAGAAGPITPGVQSVLAHAPFLLVGTDNGVPYPNPGWEDGIYEYHDDNSACLAVDTDGPADDGFIDTGLYSAEIDSTGAYDSIICGTGLWTDRGPEDWTTVDLTPIEALGPGEDIADATYQITFAARTGPMQILALTDGGETLTGGGIAHITPNVGNCVTTDVSEFAVQAVFGLRGL